MTARTSEARTPRSNRLPGNDELFRPTSPGEDRTAVGIHNYGAGPGGSTNKATRITNDVFNNIEFWKGLGA